MIQAKAIKMAKSVNCREYFVDSPGIVEIRWMSHDMIYKATDLFNQQATQEGIKGLPEGFGKKNKLTTEQGYFTCIMCECDLKSMESLRAHCKGSQHIKKAVEIRKDNLDKQQKEDERDEAFSWRKDDTEEKSSTMNKMQKERQSKKILEQKIMKLFISNVANGTTNQELRFIFETCSPVIEASVIPGKSIAFVHIAADMETVDKVINELNGLKVNGQRIGVTMSTTISRHWRKVSSEYEEYPEECINVLEKEEKNEKSNIQVEIETLKKAVEQLQVRIKSLQKGKRYCLEKHENFSLDQLQEYKKWCLENHSSTEKVSCGASASQTRLKDEEMDLNRSYHEVFEFESGKFSVDDVKHEEKYEPDSFPVLERKISEIEHRNKNQIFKEQKLFDTNSEYVELDLDMTLKEEIEEEDARF